MNGINSLNPKFFHMAVLQCKNFRASNINLQAPAKSPNTDGMHIEKSTTVVINGAHISTGDDCISIGHGTYDIVLSGITCTAGHGISLGSLGRYQGEWDVKGLIVKDSTLSGTTNGVRIKTWENSPSWSKANNITFQNIQMNNVYNPIIIDQNYCPYSSCDHSVQNMPSQTIYIYIY
jgi:galacturan 1,4-alpha-galacturonidase